MQYLVIALRHRKALKWADSVTRMTDIHVTKSGNS